MVYGPDSAKLVNGPGQGAKGTGAEPPDARQTVDLGTHLAYTRASSVRIRVQTRA